MECTGPIWMLFGKTKNGQNKEWTKQRMDKEWTKNGQRMDKEWTKNGQRTTIKPSIYYSFLFSFLRRSDIKFYFSIKYLFFC
jgi:hypothetical protein